MLGCEQVQHDDQIDLEIEEMYKKYLKTKMSSSNTVKKQRSMKEDKNNHPSAAPEITFSKLKEVGQNNDNFNKLLQFMGCQNYQQALIKVNEIRKQQKFIKNVLEMVRLSFPNQEINLVSSWKIIKEAVQLQVKNKQFQ